MASDAISPYAQGYVLSLLFHDYVLVGNDKAYAQGYMLSPLRGWNSASSKLVRSSHQAEQAATTLASGSVFETAKRPWASTC